MNDISHAFIIVFTLIDEWIMVTPSHRLFEQNHIQGDQFHIKISNEKKNAHRTYAHTTFGWVSYPSVLPF